MKNQSNTFLVTGVSPPGLARNPRWLTYWLGAWLALTMAPHPTATAQLAITEVMSWSAATFGTSVVVGAPDYWELSNLGTNDIDLTGYRFNDFDGGTSQAYANSFQGLVIKARESIVFHEDVISADLFRAWWGLGTNVQVIAYPDEGYGFAETGDSVLLWGPVAVDEADVVDVFEFGQATPGFSFTYDSITGEWGVPSVLGIDGAFKAATTGDIGSPGTNTGSVNLSFAEQPVSVLANPGDAVTFSVRHRGLPRPTFQWFHNNEPILDARYSSHSVPSAQSSDAGSYTVVLSNFFQVVTSATATLFISTTSSPPRFIQSLTDLWVFPDQEAKFPSVATGLPQPSYQWRRNGIHIPGETNRVLVIPAPHEIETNVYSVVASNLLGAVTNEAKLLVFERPDLRITELMAREMPSPGNFHEDWWELTNFGTNAVDLFGYRFDDFTRVSQTLARPRLQYAWVITNHVIIDPRESIVFVETMAAEEFRRWWGRVNLPPALQIITYTVGGLSFSQTSVDGLGLWNMGATRDDDVVNGQFTEVSYSALDIPDALGVSFTTDPNDDDSTCCYQFSLPGVNGAFVAPEGGDIGSPGYVRTPTDPRILSIAREPPGWRLIWRSVIAGSYVVQYRDNLTAGNWLDVATVSDAGATTSYLDTSVSSSAQRFYRVRRLP